MKPVVNTKLLKSKDKVVRNDTAYFIFDRANLLPFRVSTIHQKMRYGGSSDPVLGMTKSQVSEYTKELVSVHGPVIDAIDYFIEGATMDISVETMAIMYDRIDKHIDAHIKAMREDPGYYIGDTFQLFEQMVEFAVAIYPRMKEVRERNLASRTSDDPMKTLLGGRASFMTMVTRDMDLTKGKKPEEKDKVDVCPLVDKFERMKMYYESSQSWRDSYV